MDPIPIELSGEITREAVGGGSKSSRVAVVMKTPDGATYVLRRQGGPAFGDTSLDPLVGRTLNAKGFLLGDTLVMREWTERR